MNLRNYYWWTRNQINLLIDLKIKNILRLIGFYLDYNKYKHINHSENLKLLNIYPCINDDTKKTQFDAHYFYQGVWATKRIIKSGIKKHVDVGSDIRWVGLLSCNTNVTFIDIRPFKTNLKTLKVIKGDILKLPFKDNSITSLSCLHVLEHIGLGRYGDKLDPEGTKKACKELERVLAVNGSLYLSLPVGLKTTKFNAHRIHDTRQIIEYFKNLKLIELSGVNDSGIFVENVNPNALSHSNYACGFFIFRKKSSKSRF